MVCVYVRTARNRSILRFFERCVNYARVCEIGIQHRVAEFINFIDAGANTSSVRRRILHNIINLSRAIGGGALLFR